MAISWPTPDNNGKTFKLYVFNRWDLNICVRISLLRWPMKTGVASDRTIAIKTLSMDCFLAFPSWLIIIVWALWWNSKPDRASMPFSKSTHFGLIFSCWQKSFVSPPPFFFFLNGQVMFQISGKIWNKVDCRRSGGMEKRERDRERSKQKPLGRFFLLTMCFDPQIFRI